MAKSFSPRFLSRGASARAVGHGGRGTPSPVTPRSPGRTPELRRSFTLAPRSRQSWPPKQMDDLLDRLARLERNATPVPGDDTMSESDGDMEFVSAHEPPPPDDASESESGRLPLERQMSLLRREAKVSEWQRRLEQQEADLCAFSQNALSGRASLTRSIGSMFSFSDLASPRKRSWTASSRRRASARAEPRWAVEAFLSGLVFEPQSSHAFAAFAAALLALAVVGSVGINHWSTAGLGYLQTPLPRPNRTRFP